MITTSPTKLIMNSLSSVKMQTAFSFFKSNVHSPSYATLTDNFEQASNLKDYCIPVNSYFPTTGIMEQLYDKMRYALKYYPSNNCQIAEVVSAFDALPNPENILLGNGSTELISWLNNLFIKDDVLIPVPSFGRWTDEPGTLGRNVHLLHYSEEHDFRLTGEEFVNEVKRSKVKNAVLCNPNNPTGSIMQKDEVLWIMGELNHLDTLVIDESFIDFSHRVIPTVKNEVAAFKNAWVLKSLGKNLGLHGLRMGYVISCTENINKLKKHVPFWNVNGISELLLKLVVNDKEEYEDSRLKVIEDRDYLYSSLKQVREFTVFPTNANFVYIRVADHINGDMLRDRLLDNQGCLVRNCGNKIGCTSQYFRIAARPKEEVDYLMAAIKTEVQFLSERTIGINSHVLSISKNLAS
jgi:threonine-phosphate decarboxylase